MASEEAGESGREGRRGGRGDGEGGDPHARSLLAALASAAGGPARADGIKIVADPELASLGPG